MHSFHSRRLDATTPDLATAPLHAMQRIEYSRFSDRHFWHGGYDKAILPFKLNDDRRHHIPKQTFKVTNWRDYDASLRQRGSLTVWFTDDAIVTWQAEPRTTRGGQRIYSALAILTALTLRTVFRLALRQTEGLIGSVLRLLSGAHTRPGSGNVADRGQTSSQICMSLDAWMPRWNMLGKARAAARYRPERVNPTAQCRSCCCNQAHDHRARPHDRAIRYCKATIGRYPPYPSVAATLQSCGYASSA